MTAAKLQAHGSRLMRMAAYPHPHCMLCPRLIPPLRIDIDIPTVVLRLKCSAQPLPRPRLFLAARPLSIACYPTR